MMMMITDVQDTNHDKSLSFSSQMKGHAAQSFQLDRNQEVGKARFLPDN